MLAFLNCKTKVAVCIGVYSYNHFFFSGNQLGRVFFIQLEYDSNGMNDCSVRIVSLSRSRVLM